MRIVLGGGLYVGLLLLMRGVMVDDIRIVANAWIPSWPVTGRRYGKKVPSAGGEAETINETRG